MADWSVVNRERLASLPETWRLDDGLPFAAKLALGFRKAVVCSLLLVAVAVGVVAVSFVLWTIL